MTSVTSSAPTLPCRARRSDILVNPETSTNTIEPSMALMEFARSQFIPLPYQAGQVLLDLGHAWSLSTKLGDLDRNLGRQPKMWPK